VDFLLLVSSQYKERRVILDDACAHCLDAIHIEVDRGKLVEVTPSETIVYQGGT
jgi:hypothetical protein